MREAWNAAWKIDRRKAVRRGVEYALAVGLALLSSYWIVQGRW
jgi:hypothetical protein